jgi:hypothetical protein
VTRKSRLDFHHIDYNERQWTRADSIGSGRVCTSRKPAAQKKWLYVICAQNDPRYVELLCQKCHHGLRHAPYKHERAQPAVVHALRTGAAYVQKANKRRVLHYYDNR